jgi:adenosylcobinamide-GDP ribazoletransferase
MKREFRIFLTAIMSLTRIRVPATIDHSPEYAQQAPRYFPLVGWIVGAVSALFFLLGARFISTDVGIVASMIAGLLITGAFHEDGFADVCDGFGGGWKKERILDIMKDSRIGAFGAIGLIAILATKFLLLKELPSMVTALPATPPGSSLTTASHGWPVSVFYPYRYFILAVISAHSLSRLMPVLVMQTSEYVSATDRSKSGAMMGRRLSPGALIAAILLAVTPLAMLPWPYWLIVLPALYATYRLNGYFKRWIGGFTGDCLGAIQQVTEIVIYLGFLIVWRYF